MKKTEPLGPLKSIQNKIWLSMEHKMQFANKKHVFQKKIKNEMTKEIYNEY